MNEQDQQKFMSENNYESNSCGGDPITPEIPNSELELIKIQSNYLTGDNSWHASRIDAFKRVVEQKFLLFPIANKIVWDTRRGIDGNLCIELTVRTQDLGQLSTDISVELLKSKTCPANLPDELFAAFKVKFENKKQRLLKEWQKENRI